jgi:tRNA (uracil-5-)-methyltransferase TRM9
MNAISCPACGVGFTSTPPDHRLCGGCFGQLESLGYEPVPDADLPPCPDCSAQMVKVVPIVRPHPPGRAEGGLTAGLMSSGQVHIRINDDQVNYDHYYRSGLYDARYPRPNPSTYRRALQLASTASRILDFGAGSGRYTLPLLDSTDAFLCAYDISDDACRTLNAHASAAGFGSQRLLVTSDLDVACAAGPYDLALALFGVLSHIEGPEDRMKILNSIRSLLTPEGLLLVTVPNAFRRFPLHASQVGHDSKDGGMRFRHRYFPRPRLVIYRHHIENAQRPFPYHLFSRRELTRELSAAGFFPEILESDSILPERRLVRNPILEPVDNVLCRLLPSWAGYGLRAVCRVGPV